MAAPPPYLWGVAIATRAASLPVRSPATGPASQGVNVVAFSPDGSTLAAADGNDSVYLGNVATGKCS